MAIRLPQQPGARQESVQLQIDKFNAGLVTLVDEARLPTNAAHQASNMMQVQDGLWAPKWGSTAYTVAGSTTVSGAGEYVKSDGTTELVEVIGTSAYKSTNGGTKTALTGASFTAGVTCFFLQIRSRLYISNGTDNWCYYDGTNLIPYTALSNPGSGPSPVKTGQTGSNYGHFYCIVAVNNVGYTTASAEGTTTSGKTRDQWVYGTDYMTVTWAAVTNALRYEIYYGDITGQLYYLDTVTSTTYVDYGNVAINPFKETPNDNTTSGPKFKQMEMSGNRIWAVGDPGNKWRVYYSGTGQNTGTFSAFYGGGYIDLEKGGRETPQAVVHYRDGKGQSYATILTSDPEGNGSIWQISLDTLTVGSASDPTSYTVASSLKVVGSLGCAGPRAVAKVNNDIMYGNVKGAYATGSRQNLLYVLATNEISANIRPTWRGLTASALSAMVCHYYDAKVFFAVPNGTSTNNEIWVFDTERRNWSLAWTGVAVKQFLEYADTTGAVHLLAVPVSGTQLIEVSENLQGDSGVAFNTTWLSGIYPVHKDRTKFAKIRYAYVEFFRPTGTITFEVLGTEKKRGFGSITSLTITDTTSSAGWSTQSWSSVAWSSSALAPETFASATVKKRLRINKLLNNIQFRITTSGLTSYYTLGSLMAKGEIIPTSDPTSWRS